MMRAANLVMLTVGTANLVLLTVGRRCLRFVLCPSLSRVRFVGSLLVLLRVAQIRKRNRGPEVSFLVRRPLSELGPFRLDLGLCETFYLGWFG